jgi:assimilatory nitrate reductase catalytic subunit
MQQLLESDAGLQLCATHCPYCALQCGMHLRPAAENSWSVEERDFPTNKGGLCQKGWTAAELLSSPQRLLTPLIRDRRGGLLRAASWEEALDRIVNAIKSIQERHGRDAVGVFGGGGLTNEKAYLLGKFARVALRTSQIDYNGRFCMSSAAAAGIKAFGIDRGLPFPLADIPEARTILLIGSNVAETMPPVMQYFQAQRKKGGSLIVVDPRETPTAAASTLHLQITPGTDAALMNGLLNIAMKEGYVDGPFIATRTRGFESVRRIASSYWAARVERITGVSENQLAMAARLLGEAATAMILTARGPEQQSHGVDNVLACINLALALGKAGKPYCGYGCLTGQGNGQGGREHGQKADQLPGYRRLDNPEHRAHIARVWGIDEADLPRPGRSAYEMFDAMGTDGGVRGLLVFGSNPVVSSPNAGHVQSRFDALDLLVVSDFFLSETAECADVVLPSAQWAEEEGTMTNLEGRVLLRKRATRPPEGVRTDTEILAALGDRLGYGRHFSCSPEVIFDELRRASAGGVADYSGITYERIAQEDGVFWPCPGAGHPGTPRMFLDRFGTADGLARFHPVEFRPPAEEPDGEYPLYLTTGRIMAQYQSGTQTRRIAALMKASPQAFVQMHPSMARTYGIEDGDPVRLITRRGSATMAAQLTPAIRMDTLFVPFHFNGAGRANLLTNAALDPLSRMPEFKVCAVRIEKGDPC